MWLLLACANPEAAPPTESGVDSAPADTARESTPPR